MSNAVELDGVTLTLGGHRVLDTVSFAVGQGRFVGVLGPNGAGKTTLFRALLGLVRPDAGVLKVLGQPARRGNPAIGYLPQVRSAPPAIPLCGRDVIAASVNGQRPGLPFAGAAVWEAVDAALATVNATDLADRPLTAMSGGERQRLLIAQALVGDPRLLILDEPLLGLDPSQQQIVVRLARDLSQRLGLTVLFSAHELNQLLNSVDRILYLGNGHAELGSVDDVIRPEVLSPLYGAPIEVLRAGNHVFVMSRGQDVEREHAHEHDRHAHS